MLLTPVPGNLDTLLLISPNGIPFRILIPQHNHMLQISNLFSILPKLNILQVVYLFLSDNQLIFTTLISHSKLFLEMLHLKDKSLLIFQPFLQDHILLFLPLQVKLEQQFVLLRWRVNGWSRKGFNRWRVMSIEDHIGYLYQL